MTERKINVLFRCEPELKERLERLATERGMTFSSLVRKILDDFSNDNRNALEEIDELRKRVEALEKKLSRK